MFARLPSILFPAHHRPLPTPLEPQHIFTVTGNQINGTD
jgi:hypothetical protein